MAPYGICTNGEKECRHSFFSRDVEKLFECLEAISSGRSKGTGELIREVERHAHFFQAGYFCVDCEWPLEKAPLPAAQFPSESKEASYSTRLNQLLECIPKLKTLAILDR